MFSLPGLPGGDIVEPMQPIDEAVTAVQTHPFYYGVLPHLLTVIGVLLAFVAIARLMSERKQPGNTFAWLLAIAFIPYIGVPLYLLLGGRKIRKLAARKAPLAPAAAAVATSAADQPTARVIVRNGAPSPVGGNRVQFITSGEDAFAGLEQGIREARESVHLMTFILLRDSVGRRIVKALAERARRGVRVRLLLDALGGITSSGTFCDPLRRAGGEVVTFMPVLPLQTRGSANLRNHRKIAIFDGRVARIGGHNLALEYMGPTPLAKRWRDFGAVIEGPAVRQLNEIFLADWSFASGQPMTEVAAEAPRADVPPFPGDSALQVVASGPDVQGEPLYEGILSMVEVAQRSIAIVTPYFIPDEVLLRLLVLKARSGVDVRIIVPRRSNHPITDWARRHSLRELQAAGASVHLYTAGMNHAKAILVDEAIGMWGSANLDLRSLFVNFEIGVITYSPADARAMAEWIDQVMEATVPLPEPPARQGFLAVIGEEASRLIAPLL